MGNACDVILMEKRAVKRWKAGIRNKMRKTEIASMETACVCLCLSRRLQIVSRIYIILVGQFAYVVNWQLINFH